MEKRIDRGGFVIWLGISCLFDYLSGKFYENFKILSLIFATVLFGIVFIGIPIIEKNYLKGRDDKLINRIKIFKNGKVYDYIVGFVFVIIFIRGTYLFYINYMA